MESKVRCFMIVKEVIKGCSHEDYVSIVKRMHLHFLKNTN
jgi:hypothetical protein